MLVVWNGCLAPLVNLAWKECAQLLVGSDVHAIWSAPSIVGDLSIQAGDINL